MENQITKQAEAYVTELLKNSLTEDYRYHDIRHTLSVRDASQLLGERYRLKSGELELLELAALFHDTGFVESYDNHEDSSKELAAGFLKKAGFPDEKIEAVLTLIEATRIGVEPKGLVEKILKDADFNTLNSSYVEKAEALRHEWELFKDIEVSDEGWMRNN